MVYLLGQSLNLHKRVYYALCVFEGVGLCTARRLCDQVCIHPLAKVKEIREEQLIRLKELLQPMMEARRQDKLLKMKLAKTRPIPLQPSWDTKQ